jgi:exonuclease III
VCLRKDWLMLGNAVRVHLPSSVDGLMLQVNVDLYNSTPITVVGMYCPHQMPARKHLYDIYTRHKTDRTTVVAGDFNATFQDSERASGVKRPQDEAHRAFMAQHGLAPVSRPSLAPQDAPRQYTYRKGASETKCSRIDDILISESVEANATVDTISMAGRSSDHDPLAAAIPFTLLGLMPPLPELPGPSRRTTLGAPHRRHQDSPENAAIRDTWSSI